MSIAEIGGKIQAVGLSILLLEKHRYVYYDVYIEVYNENEHSSGRQIGRRGI
jgi:hypothetical protein